MPNRPGGRELRSELLEIQMRFLRKLTMIAVVLPLTGLFLFILGCNLWVVLSTRDRVLTGEEGIEEGALVLVLGTSKKVGPETPNPHFENRIEAAVALFESGKAGGILVSGHRSSRYYDEVKDMRERLREHGVPEEIILSDPLGLRTYDSIERARTEFGFDRIVIVSDRFHVHRALFIADRTGVEAVAYRSEPVPFRISGQTRFRECFARVKAVLDLYLVSPGKAERQTWFTRRWRSSEWRELRQDIDRGLRGLREAGPARLPSIGLSRFLE